MPYGRLGLPLLQLLVNWLKTFSVPSGLKSSLQVRLLGHFLYSV